MVTDLQANGEVTMALFSDGRALCWGSAYGGACGLYDVIPGIPEPEVVRASDCLSRVFPGYADESFALLHDGSFVRWRAGLGPIPKTGAPAGPGVGTAPIAVPGTIVDASVTGSGGMVLTGDGDFYFWGIGSEDVISDAPAKYPAPGRVTQLEGDGGNCFLVEDGSVYCFGYNYTGILGPTVPLEGSSFDPVRIDLPGPAQKVDVGYSSACALLVDGEVWCWGKNSFGGILGVPHEEVPLSVVPLRIQSLPAAEELHTEEFAACVLDASRRATCWGSGAALFHEPAPVWPPRPWHPELEIAKLSLATYPCALTTDGRVFCTYYIDDNMGEGFLDLDYFRARAPATDVCVAAGGGRLVRCMFGR